MGVDVKIAGTNYTGVPYITLPLTAGGSVKFCEVSDTTATASDVASGKKFYTASGELATGTAPASGDVDTRKSFTVVQKANQTLSVIPGGASSELFSTSTDSSGNTIYKTEYPNQVIIKLSPSDGYNAGKITINGVEKDSDTSDLIQCHSDLVDGMVISATDATVIPLKTFPNVTLNLVGSNTGGILQSFGMIDSYDFKINSQNPNSAEINVIGIGRSGNDKKYYILFITDEDYSSCTIKLDTNTGTSDNEVITRIDKGTMIGEISDPMYSFLSEMAKNEAEFTLTITVVS